MDFDKFLTKLSQGIKAGTDIIGKSYGLVCNTSKSTAVAIIDKSSKSGKLWFIRFDNPHPHTPYDHININRLITHVKDPHIPLPSGSTNVIGKIGKTLNFINDNITTIAVAISGINLTKALYKDVKADTVNNTVETIGSLSGGFIGGYTGATAGSLLGSVIFPGVGTIVGGFSCAIVGAMYGANEGEKLSKASYDYIEDKIPKEVRGKVQGMGKSAKPIIEQIEDAVNKHL